MRFIPKFQQGSGFISYTPFMPSMPTPLGGMGGQSGVGGSSASNKSGTSSILDDDTFKELLTKGGLTNDVIALTGQLAKMEASNALPYMQTDNRISATRMISKVNELRNSKKDWEEAIKTADKNEALNEVAIGSGREVYTKNTQGQLQAISLPNYVAKGGKEQLLTVAEVMKERQDNPALVGQNGLFNVANNAVGLNQITKQVNSMIKAFGTITQDDTKFISKPQLVNQIKGFEGRKPTQDEAQSLQKLNEIASTPGDYLSVRNAVTSQKTDVNKAVRYIWDTLGEKAQNKLYAVAAMSGEKDPTKVIVDMVMNGTNYSETSDVVPKELPGMTASEKNAGQKPASSFQLFNKDMYKIPDLSYTFNIPGLSTYLEGAVGSVGPLPYPDNTSPGMVPFTNVLEEGGYKRILKTDSISFGDNNVDPTQTNYIVTANEDAAKTYMPVGKYGKVDWDEFKRFKKVYATYEANKQWTADESTAFFKKNHYNLQISTDYVGGKKERIIMDNADIKPFLLIPAYTNDRAPFLKNIDDNLIKLDSTEEKRIKPLLDQIWTVKVDAKHNKDIGPGSSMFTNYYKGLIAVPYRTDYAVQVDAMEQQGPKVPSYTLGDVQRNLNYSSNTSQNIKLNSASALQQ